MKTVALLALTLFPCLSFASANQEWLADFAQLKGMVAETYPNLDVALNVYKLNLAELDRQTQARLQKAASSAEAAAILKDFVAQFKDGHFRIGGGDEDESKTPPLPPTASGPIACGIMGAQPKNFNLAVLADREAGFGDVHLQGSAFPHTIFRIGKRKIGFVRIPSFSGRNYPELCAEEWARYRKSLRESCDEDCQDQFLGVVMGNRLIREFREALVALKKERIESLVVDVTDNGGGTDWVSASMRMLTKRPILCGQFGFIRHAHWTRQFTDRLKELRTARPADREKIQRTEDDLAESKKPCDRSGIWRNATPACELVVRHPVLDCEPGKEFHFARGVYSGPLFVLANKNTASAAEDFVGRLKESGAAKIIGWTTLGAGCGFTNHGIPLRLTNLGLPVHIPDCARYLRSGANEVQGLAPDVVLPAVALGSPALTSALKSVLNPVAPGKTE